MDFREAMAATLRAERAAIKGMSTHRLAEVSGVSRATIVRLESGSRPGDLDQLHRIATALGMRGSDLWRKAEERSQSDQTVSTFTPSAESAGRRAAIVTAGSLPDIPVGLSVQDRHALQVIWLELAAQDALSPAMRRELFDLQVKKRQSPPVISDGPKRKRAR